MNRQYTASCGIAGDVNDTIKKYVSYGNMILMYTDRFLCCGYQKADDIDHLLEVRVFNRDSEIKIMRPTIDDEFYYRFIDDTQLESSAYIEELHYLDIDTEATKSYGSVNDYVTTGGGRYSLPVENAEKVRVRNYISFDEQNIAQITDFRVVEFLRKGEA